MLRLILTATAIMAAGSAMASSIDVISGARTGNSSIVAMRCDTCPSLKTNERKQIYNVPVLTEGFQKVEIREAGDEKQIVRTEKWSGGSPVIRISAARTWMPDETGTIVAVRPSDPANDGIDRKTTTAAVDSGEKILPAIAGTSPVPAAAPAPQDFTGFSLRTN